MIGRSLRAAIDLQKLGERSIVIDCDVLEADGGTRTACVTAGWLALVLALEKLQAQGIVARDAVLREQIAAVSAGHVGGELALDLCYAEDSTARVDLNLVGTARGEVVEVQGTAEGEPVARTEVDKLMDLALRGVAELCLLQTRVLEEAGISLHLDR